MAIPVLILGESGTGKSASLRNFNASEVKVINVEGKPLPFKNKFEVFSSDNYVKILKEMQLTKKPVIVIDDAQYLMANEFMRRATERGYDKFTEIAQNFWNLVNKVKELPDNQIVYFLAHIERDQNGNEKIKTIGKLLDEKITVEGMFTIVLKTNVNDGEYTFLTQNSGHDTVKSPIGMFKSFAIENDLKYVDEKIRNYYEIGEFKSDAEMEKADEAVAAKAPELEEKKPSRRGRRQTAAAEQEIKEQETETPIEEELQEAAEPVDNDPTPDVRSDSEEVVEPAGSVERPRRRGRRAVTEAAVANTVSEEVKEEVPFDEAPQPVIPQRKRREEPTEDIPSVSETDEPSENAPVRRRRRRI